ncbi:hypothetical protein [Couchioplanes azureus]|uniref:hypothetical protein n=1 Tax=Couchioplanes caeruleus TaxID=56438 RepID=UPI001670ED80|nr:hypothetical protein [Couchioplanes caeruleus]GGQ83732.1 hypothetical protein GCM10010166_62390 [Couchioplanes caeruleus subsp. azureus]
MSRYDLTPHNAHTVSCVVIGWDRPLGSFFTHVYMTDDDNPFDEPTIGIGDDFHEVTEPTAAIELASMYAEVPEDMSDILTADAAHEGYCATPAVLGILHAAAQPTPNTDAWPCPF